MPPDETCDLIQWRQTDLVGYFQENIHTIDEAIVVGRVLVAAGNQCRIAIGQLAHYVEKGKAGRGLKGGIREFARGIGIPHNTLLGYMKATATKELVARATNLGIRKTEEAERAPDPEAVYGWIDDTIAEEVVVPSCREIQRVVQRQLEKRDGERKEERRDEYEKAHGHKLPDRMFEHLSTTNVCVVNDPVRGYEGLPGFHRLKVKDYPHGAMPPTLALRMMWVWLNPGDLVLDPMAGRGIVSTVCKMFQSYEAAQWRCLSYDINPKSYNNHPDVFPYPEDMPHGIWDGLPPEAAHSNPGLVFLDPDYYNMRKNSLGNLPFRDVHHYFEFQNHIIDVAANVVRVGGCVAYLIMDHADRDENGRRYGVGRSLVAEACLALQDHPNLEYDGHINCPIPPGVRGRPHALVRTDQSLAGCSRILWVARRVA